jgi:small conductance mechanosensitive channel
VLGTVEDIGLFMTTINTLDNIRTFVGNGKIFADNIQNFSANAYRRMDLVAQLNHSVLINPAGKDPTKPFRRKKMVWMRFGIWLLLGLEFELAADIVRTAISP